MTQKGYINDFYKQFEELNKKLDQANETISTLLLNNSILSTEIKELNIKLDEANKKNQELLLEIERLKNNNNKDSSNSSKPSSTNGFKKGSRPTIGINLVKSKVDNLIIKEKL